MTDSLILFDREDLRLTARTILRNELSELGFLANPSDSYRPWHWCTPKKMTYAAFTTYVNYNINF